MPRLVVQSLTTGKFLIPSMDDGQPTWVQSLREAGGGVVTDEEQALQLLDDWCELEDQPIVINLDRLGTAGDY